MGRCQWFLHPNAVAWLRAEGRALEVNDNMLCVKGQRTEETAGSRKHPMREIADGPFVRMFKLPTSMDQTRHPQLKERPADDSIPQA